ncbi:hypothetical protein [Methanobacterium oryzae]|uniref:hypothetical protein n=1 Tax=Methanobacterium oryzae TaxID=69540 RepID=UPI003D252655
MEAKTRRMIVYLCAAVLVILGLYNLLIIKDYYMGLIWTVFGILFIILGYFKIKV